MQFTSGYFRLAGPSTFGVMLLVIIFAAGCTDTSVQDVDRKGTDGSAENSADETTYPSFELIQNAHYVDDAICAECHQEIFDSYQQVAMSKSFYDFDPDNTVEAFDDNHFFHEPSGNHYEMKVADGKLSMTRFREREDGSRYCEHEQSAQYVVGSGNHVRTYLSRNENGELYQLPVVWYSQDKKWGMAPGYDRPDHLDFGRQITRQCMFCHNAYPEFEVGSDVYGKPHRFPKKMPQGIGCQRCHGPGSEHVRISNEADADSPGGLARIEGSIINSAKLNPELQDDVCNQCHFQPMSQRTSFVRKFGQGDYGYLPGKPLADYMLHFEPDRNNDVADHFEINHHPYRLFQSQCYIKTPGGIRCTDCHDPHRKIEKPQQAAYYREKCFSCHGKNDCGDVQRGRAADADCVSCHMQPRRTTDVVNVTMTDHKIVRRPSIEDPVAPLKEIDVPIDMSIRKYEFAHRNSNSDQSDEKKFKLYQLFARALDDDEKVFGDLATAIAQRKTPPIETNLQLAQMQLQYRKYDDAQKTLRSLDSQLSIYHTHMGVSQIGSEDFQAAIGSLTTATEVDPTNAAAWYNLGTAKQRAKDLTGAVTCLERAIKLQPNYSKACRKLGIVLAVQGRLDEASRWLNRAVSIDPRDLAAYHSLAAVNRDRSDFARAIQVLTDAASNPAGITDEKTQLELVWTLLDPKNEKHRDSKRAMDLSNRVYVRNQQTAETTLTRIMAQIESGDSDEAIKFLGTSLEKLEQANRKPEAGLLLAVCQLKLQSEASAKQNYVAARTAFNSKASDRIGRLIRDFADKRFADAE